MFMLADASPQMGMEWEMSEMRYVNNFQLCDVATASDRTSSCPTLDAARAASSAAAAPTTSCNVFSLARDTSVLPCVLLFFLFLSLSLSLSLSLALSLLRLPRALVS